MSKTVLNDDIESKAGDLDKQTSMNEFFGKNEKMGENEIDGNHIVSRKTDCGLRPLFRFGFFGLFSSSSWFKILKLFIEVF